MPLQAIDQTMEQTFTDNVLKALLTKDEIDAEESAIHPIALLARVCGCSDVP
jgi:hypothetical protein